VRSELPWSPVLSLPCFVTVFSGIFFYRPALGAVKAGRFDEFQVYLGIATGVFTLLSPGLCFGAFFSLLSHLFG